MTSAEPLIDMSEVTFGADDSVETETPVRTRRKRSDAGQPRGTRTTSTTRKTPSTKLADELLLPYAMVAKAMSSTMPTASAVMIARGEKTTSALVAIADKHPKMRKALENVGKVGPGADIGETLIMIVIAVNVDLGRIPPNHPMAFALGVTSLHSQIYSETPTGQPTVVDMPDLAPPPTYMNPPTMANDPQHPMYSFQAGRNPFQ